MSDFYEDLPTLAGADGSGAAPAPQTSIGKVGRYKITCLIGEGGMGAVYEAEQDQPRRTVALKVIKPGLASPELLRRFAQESQALGRLQHPGIAQIYDAGTADTGYGPQPYFAMEFIRGEGLRDYAESHHLNTRQRLEIVVKVCEAVHHAHQRGLIHRDLKPGNILVDETGQPKILDFGVARVTDSDAQATMQTDVGQLVGTLAYMSPEQVLADPLEIDIRSDVYALGVILYELLAGRLPYNISKKLHEALNTIREEDPSKLSSISRTYRGDIETIAAKALEKDKTRRYASAAELGADITHYLKDEPIVAQPPSTSYQLKKFARRNKALVMGIAAVFVVLLLGAVVSAYQAVRATRAEKAAVLDRDRAEAAGKAAAEAAAAALVAKGEAEAAEIRATKDRDDAIEQKLRADTEAATAKAVSEFMQKNLFEQVTGGPGSTSDLSVSVALDRAASKIDGAFEKNPLVEAGVREAVASAYVTLALADRAATQAERALALRRRIQGDEDKDTLKTMHLLGNVNRVRRNYAEGEGLLTRVVAISTRKFGRDHADTLASALDLAYLYLLDQKFDEAARYALAAAEGRRRTLGAGHKDTINASLILSRAHEARKDLPQALKWATSAHDSSRRAFGEADSLTLAAASVRQEINLKMTPNAPTNAAARAELFDNATRALDSITATSLPAMIDLAIRRANVAVQQNKPEDAVPPLVEAIDAARRAGQEDLMLSAFLGGVYALQKKFTEAEATLRPVLAKPEAWNGLGNLLHFALRSLGAAYRNDGKLAEAEAYFSRLVPFERVTPGEAVVQTRVDMFALAEIQSGQRKYAEAERSFGQLLEVQRRVSTPEAINTVATIANIGWVRLQQKRFTDAEQSFREALAILTRTPASTSWERFNVDSMLGATLAAQRKFDEAEPLLISGYEGMKTAQRATTNANTSRFTQDQAAEAIAQLYADWGKPAKQTEWNEKIKATP
jgi:hypothetical protein